MTFPCIILLIIHYKSVIGFTQVTYHMLYELFHQVFPLPTCHHSPGILGVDPHPFCYIIPTEYSPILSALMDIEHIKDF